MNQIINQQQNMTVCPLCKSKMGEVLAHSLRRGNGTVSYCSTCEHGYLVQEQSVDAKEYYGELYRQEYSHNSDVAATNAREIYQVYKNYQQDRLRNILPFLSENSRVLEVGASSGQFLCHIKSKVGEVNAIELDKACCEFLSHELGVDVDAEFLENSRFASQTYDLVCAFQVIEHVEQPVEFLKTLRQVTKPEGVIFVEAPNLRDPLLSVWDVPTYRKFFYHSAHLHYFTEASLRKVALDAGFRANQIEIKFIQDYNILNHLHWIMNDGPQTDCHVGLSEINLRGSDKEISAWLTEEMKSVNDKYIAKLVAAKCTSNMLMKLHND